MSVGARSIPVSPIVFRWIRCDSVLFSDERLYPWLALTFDGETQNRLTMFWGCTTRVTEIDFMMSPVGGKVQLPTLGIDIVLHTGQGG